MSTEIKEGSVITVLGSKGGTGKSLVALNTAIEIANLSVERVLLVDMDPFFSCDICNMLSMERARSIEEVSELIEDLDSRLLKGLVSFHKSGIGVLPLSKDGYSPEVHNRTIEQIFYMLKDIFSYIVVDIGKAHSPFTNLCIDLSHLLVVVTEPSIIALEQTRYLIEYLSQLHIPREMSPVVINRYDGTVPIEHIYEKLKRDIIAVIPEEEDIVREANLKGEAIVSLYPKDSISLAFKELAVKILGGVDRKGQPWKGLLNEIREKGLYARPKSTSSLLSKDLPHGELSREEQIRRLKMEIHQHLLEEMDLKRLDIDIAASSERKAELTEKARRAIVRLLDQQTEISLNREERRHILKDVLSEAIGLGLLEDLIEDPEIDEIMVNGYDQIYVERKGKLEIVDRKFTSDDQLMGIIERIVAPLGRRIDMSSPMVDARLPDGSRVNAIIPPLSLKGPILTIRKFSKRPFTDEDLINFGTMNVQIRDFLSACVRAKMNILISGGTGSGKTTLLNVVSSFIPEEERIITIEDSAELKLHQVHVVRLEARPPNIEGKGEITIRDLVRNALRMRPDRIIVGECRGAETVDMLQAMNTGHDGSLTTIHANSPRDSFSRLETMYRFSGFDIPSRSIQEQIAAAIDLIVHVARFRDGTRKITQISEITGMEGTIITMQDIFVFKEKGIDERGRVVGNHVATGFVPKFMDRFTQKGIEIPREIFWDTSAI